MIDFKFFISMNKFIMQNNQWLKMKNYISICLCNLYADICLLRMVISKMFKLLNWIKKKLTMRAKVLHIEAVESAAEEHSANSLSTKLSSSLATTTVSRFSSVLGTSKLSL